MHLVIGGWPSYKKMIIQTQRRRENGGNDRKEEGTEGGREEGEEGRVVCEIHVNL